MKARPPMNPEVARAWAAALRSGHYPQGQRRLRARAFNAESDAWSSLGVLCDLHSRTGKGKWVPAQYDRVYVYQTGAADWNGSRPPVAVRAWAGLEDPAGDALIAALADRNDIDQASFPEIAAFLEAQSG